MPNPCFILQRQSSTASATRTVGVDHVFCFQHWFNEALMQSLGHEAYFCTLGENHDWLKIPVIESQAAEKRLQNSRMFSNRSRIQDPEILLTKFA